MRTTLRGRRNPYAWRDDLSRRLHLDDDQWHDGRLVGLSIDTSGRGAKTELRATLRVEVYGEGTDRRRRTSLTATFGGVREVVAALNGRELADPGDSHVVFARLNETSEMLDLSVYVVGGHLRIVAERMTVATRLGRGRTVRRS